MAISQETEALAAALNELYAAENARDDAKRKLDVAKAYVVEQDARLMKARGSYDDALELVNIARTGNRNGRG
jgi:hypothetical protein